MKESMKKETHVGLQPIRVLKHNLTARLENRSKDLIKLLQHNSKLNKYISYESFDEPLINGQKPYIDKDGIIHIHETFLSYLWIISFTMFVLYEEAVAIPDLIKRNIQPPKSQNVELIKLTEELFDYAKSLVRVFSKWDTEYFPNPEFFDRSSDEGFYIERNNDLYVEAMNFILFHEIAHAEFEHIKKKNVKRLNNEELKEMELEADSRAINLLLKEYRSKNLSDLSIIVGLASILFCGQNLSGGNKHPDIDIRLENALQIINPADDSPVWAFLVLFIKLWDKQFSHNFIENSEYDSFKAFYYELITQAKKL
ncbi:hypothetical protein H9Q08_03200 [Chryseobacterium sp. PS-8]|uniref:Peptidase U49 n=1 Tax=Chryseobacterium indicum TaxID=2766954 RepID=A0ABS9C1E1_9FLAO|nr:phage exclusion protein Lit family protein [Chryseobacterium sp. PS-8]MCF2218306.1 hypothetical protein [Chryseobacterium sp. PS-8]